VIEIGAFHEFTDVQRDFINQIMPSIGIVINTAESRTMMQELLKTDKSSN
jgi:hypothetical protein